MMPSSSSSSSPRVTSRRQVSALIVGDLKLITGDVPMYYSAPEVVGVIGDSIP